MFSPEHTVGFTLLSLFFLPEQNRHVFSVLVKNSMRPITLQSPENQRVGYSFSAHYRATVCLIGVTKLHLGELTPQTASSS